MSEISTPSDLNNASSTAQSNCQVQYNEAPILTALPRMKAVNEMTDEELSARHQTLRTVAFQPQTLASHLEAGAEKQQQRAKAESKAKENAALLQEFL